MAKIDFDLRQLEIFREVVDLGSFSKAAAVVCLAQASVSERIATLENLVGTRLLDRLGRRVTPTRAGELLYKHAVLLLDLKQTAVQEMEEFLGMKQGEIRLGASTIPGSYILPGLFGEFYRDYPGVSIHLVVSDTASIERRILEGVFDLGVVGSKSREQNLIHHELWDDELVLAVPGTHAWARRKTVHVRELLDQPFILREPGSGTLKIMDHYLEESGFGRSDRLRLAARLGTSTAVKEGIKAGLGISILSERALETEVRSGILNVLRLKGLRMVRRFYLIRDRRRIAAPLCRAMAEFLTGTALKQEKEMQEEVIDYRGDC
jgi:DNA-binding transcriptional LysR family regulator